MSLLPYDVIWETATNPGTGTVSLLGARTDVNCESTGFNLVGDSNSCTVRISRRPAPGVTNPEWEVSDCTFTLAGRLLAHNTVHRSSSGTSKVNFTAAMGTLDVALVRPAKEPFGGGVFWDDGTTSITAVSASEIDVTLGGTLAVKITTGFSPLSLSPTVWIKADGTLWQDSARSTPVTLDGQNIGAADDASGNGNHALTGASAAASPLWATSIFGSLPALSFPDTVKRYLQTAPYSVALTNPFTILCACQPNGSGSRGFYDGEVNNRGLFGVTDLHWQITDGHLLTSSNPPDTNPHVFAALFNGASSLLYEDGGSAVISGDAGSNGQAALTLGGTGTSGTAPLVGYILEIIVLPYLATLSQINAAGAYMAARLGTTWTTAT